jgi:hypothetical protein
MCSTLLGAFFEGAQTETAESADIDMQLTATIARLAERSLEHLNNAGLQVYARIYQN